MEPEIKGLLKIDQSVIYDDWLSRIVGKKCYNLKLQNIKTNHQLVLEAIEDLKKFKRFKAGLRCLRKECIRKSDESECPELIKKIFLDFAKELEAFEEIQ